jgi:hypothetical protein
MVTQTLSHILILITPSIKIYSDHVLLLLMVDPMVDFVDLLLLFYLKTSSLLNVTGITDNTLQKALYVLLLGSFRVKMVPSIVFSINMHTMALVRLSILSPSYVILATLSTTVLVFWR